MLERARLRPEAAVGWYWPSEDGRYSRMDDVELMRELGRRAAQSPPPDYYGSW